MLKITLTLLVVLISIYWVGEKVRKNPKIDAFLSAIEGNYSRLNSRLEDATTISGLRFLRQLYGWVSIFLFVCLFVFQRFFQLSSASFFSLFWLFGFAFMSWFSIKWVIDHKNTMDEFSKNNVLIIFGPLLMGVLDIVFHTPFTEILLASVQQVAAALHFNMPNISNPLAIGGAISLFLFVFFCFYYFLAWAVAVPVFMLSVFAVVLPIRFARALAQIDRNNTFFWFTVFVMIVISVLLTQL